MATYLDFVLTMFFAFGVAFEVPVAVVLLVLTGIVQVETLGKNRGYVIIGIFVVAAFLTPPDAISQMHHGRCRCGCSTRAGWSWHASCRRCAANRAEAARKKKPKRVELANRCK